MNSIHDTKVKDLPDDLREIVISAQTVREFGYGTVTATFHKSNPKDSKIKTSIDMNFKRIITTEQGDPGS